MGIIGQWAESFPYAEPNKLSYKLTIPGSQAWPDIQHYNALMHASINNETLVKPKPNFLPNALRAINYD